MSALDNFLAQFKQISDVIIDSYFICDNERNRRLLARVTAPKEVREYPGARHILEFSGQRAAFLNDLAVWFAWREAG